MHISPARPAGSPGAAVTHANWRGVQPTVPVLRRPNRDQAQVAALAYQIALRRSLMEVSTGSGAVLVLLNLAAQHPSVMDTPMFWIAMLAALATSLHGCLHFPDLPQQ